MKIKSEHNEIFIFDSSKMLKVKNKHFKSSSGFGWRWFCCCVFYVMAGFRKGMGTTDNIFILHGLISHGINNNEKLFAAFVDFQKAFDYIVHDILWFKLVEIGVRAKCNQVNLFKPKVKSKV